MPSQNVFCFRASVLRDRIFSPITDNHFSIFCAGSARTTFNVVAYRASISCIFKFSYLLYDTPNPQDILSWKTLQQSHVNVNMPRFTLCSAPSQGTVSAQSWNESIASHLSHLVNQTKASQTVWWLDICDASEEDVLHAARALNVHPLSVEDVVTREPREKVEVFRNYYLISFQTLVSKEDGVGGFCSTGDAAVDKSPSSDVLFILVFLNGVLTFSPGGCNHAYRVRDRIRKMYDPGVLSGDWICYALMYVSLFGAPSY